MKITIWTTQENLANLIGAELKEIYNELNQWAFDVSIFNSWDEPFYVSNWIDVNTDSFKIEPNYWLTIKIFSQNFDKVRLVSQNNGTNAKVLIT